MMPTKTQVRASILKLNYDMEFKARLKAGDDPEVARVAAEIAVMEIRARWEEADRPS